MELHDFLDHLNQGKTVVGGSPARQFMHQASQEALRVTGQLNTGYHPGGNSGPLLPAHWQARG